MIRYEDITRYVGGVSGFERSWALNPEQNNDQSSPAAKPYSGVVWYDLRGLEPDMPCRNCGDDLG